jgi:hypothetical protein
VEQGGVRALQPAAALIDEGLVQPDLRARVGDMRGGIQDSGTLAAATSSRK